MFNHITYLRDIATKLVAIQHTEDLPRFHRVTGIGSLEELIINMGHTTGYQLVVEDNLNGRFTNNQSQNWLNNQLFAFYVLKQTTEADPADMETVKAGCLTIAKQILSKLKKDHLADHRVPLDLSVNNLCNLDTSSIRYSGIGPLGDHYYGIQIFFTVVDPSGIVYNESEWLNDPAS